MKNDWKGMKSWLFIFYVLYAHLDRTSATGVPVMLWSGESSSSLVNPLHKTSRHEFERILVEEFGKTQPPIILFVKDNFCIEDIMPNKQKLQELYNAGSLSYLASVESPVSVFENLSSYNVTVEDELDSVVEGQLAKVQITDLNVIPEIYNIVRESSPNVVVALTGKSCGFSFERSKRAVGSSNNTDSPLIISLNKKILFYADKNPAIKFKDNYVQLGNPTSTGEHTDYKNYNLTMTFTGVGNGPSKISLKAQFNITRGYFRLLCFEYVPDGQVSQTLILKSKSDITFPFNFSYHDPQESIFSYKDKEQQVSLKITNLQVQMDTNKFGAVYDSVGFMTIPIWTGIFVTAILALIMIWGLTMIMDIRTMDRFDDPKGKTITISAQE